MISNEQILSLLSLRKSDRGRQFEVMRQVRDAYNGDFALPVPEIDGMSKPAVANLLAQGLDAISQRIASTMPDPVFPVLKEGIKTSILDSRQRRDVVTSWWLANNMDLKLAKRARWYTGYASSIVQVKPGKEQPEWILRDPLTSFPSDCVNTDDVTVDDCVFTFNRSWQWLLSTYGYLAQTIERPKNTLPGDQFAMVEYCDGNEWVLLCLGRTVANSDNRLGSQAAVRLESVENRTGMCPVSAAGRITLDRPAGQFDGMIGMYWQQAMLMALELIAVRRGVFADTWLVPNTPGVTPQIIVQADGLRGITGKVKDGTIQNVNENPGYKTDATLDRLERAQRLTGKIPSDFGGESSPGIRTGARGQDVLASVVDFPVQEAQRTFAKALQHENQLAIAIDKEYYGSTVKTVWVGNNKTTYTPEGLWVRDGKLCDHHTVKYSFAGVDANNLRLSTLQSTGAGTMSKRRGMELDPLIEDVDQEMQRIAIEQIDMAGMQGLQQQAATGAIPPGDIGRIKTLMRQGNPWEDAVAQAQQEAQARQATPAPAAAPEVQPGIAQPGMGAEQPASIAPPAAGTSNLAGLLHSLGAAQPGAAA